MERQRRELGMLRLQLDKARMGVRVAMAQLEQAKDEYRRRVATARVSVGDEPLERVQILQELKGVERQIATTGVVRAPRAGVVKKIKWLGMVDETLQVEVSLGINNQAQTITVKRG